MSRLISLSLLTVLCSGIVPLYGADWRQFRGPGGQGKSDETSLPQAWSAKENLSWQADLPGPGGSSPIVVAGRVFVTCYTGYGLQPNEGEQQTLRRHLLCFDRATGKQLWQRSFEPKLPEHAYRGEGAYHGYSSSTPGSDGERLYVFFGKSGLFCFDLAGKLIWEASAGDGIHPSWGSGCSPLLSGDLVIVNASAESGALVAFDKRSGREVWRAGGIQSSWNTPLLVTTEQGGTELVVSIQARLLGFDPADGRKLWDADGIHRYVCPSVVADKGVVYAIGGGHTSLAVRAGGKGDVTDSHVLWRQKRGSNVSSPVLHQGHLYWANARGGVVYCQHAETGKVVYQQRLEPRPGRFWASATLADGKIYYVSQHQGTYVVAAQPEFKLLAHNRIEGDESRTNASIAVSDGRLYLRSDQSLYCIGQ